MGVWSYFYVLDFVLIGGWLIVFLVLMEFFLLFISGSNLLLGVEDEYFGVNLGDIF